MARPGPPTLRLEFANGPVTSPWGRKRRDLGHPEPFHLKMIGVGNEQWGPEYVERSERAILEHWGTAEYGPAMNAAEHLPSGWKGTGALDD